MAVLPPGLHSRGHTQKGARMPAAAESVQHVLDSAAPGRANADARETRLSILLLRAIDAYDSRHREGPTVPELAADLGITPDFGHHDLVTRLKSELSLGHISHHSGRVRLTRAGRVLAGTSA
jgi:hypothetical protein